MGEQMRSIAAEAAYNKRWLIGLIAGPLLLGVLAAAWILSVAGSLPAELASHWNSKNVVDGWMSVAGAAWMAVAMGAMGAVIAPTALLLRAKSLLLARVGVGFGLAFGLALVALSVAMVAGQINISDVSRAEISGPVMAVGIALAFVVGCAAVWLYRPGEVDRTISPEVMVANMTAADEDSLVAVAAKEKAASGESMSIRVSMGVWRWVLSLGVGAVVALSVSFIFPFLALLGALVAAIIWMFTSGIAGIDPDGVRVRVAGRWKIMPLGWGEIRKATVEDIKVLDYGGWGYRMSAGSIGFIMGSGPALVLEAGFHQRYVISMPDLATASEAAALVNAYLHNGKVKG